MAKLFLFPATAEEGGRKIGKDNRLKKTFLARKHFLSRFLFRLSQGEAL